MEKKTGLQLYVQWQGMSIVEMRREDRATRNAGDSVPSFAHIRCKRQVMFTFSKLQKHA